MMPHSLGGQGHAGHEAKRVNEILALEGAVQLAILNAPTLECGELRRDLLLGQLLDTRGEPPQFIVAPACRGQFFRSGGGSSRLSRRLSQTETLSGFEVQQARPRLRLCVGAESG